MGGTSSRVATSGKADVPKKEFDRRVISEAALAFVRECQLLTCWNGSVPPIFLRGERSLAKVPETPRLTGVCVIMPEEAPAG
jgi:hypothetical protein